MTTKITYEFEATADNAQLLVDINNLIARNVLAIETAATLTTMMEKPTPVTEEDKAAILTALGEEPGQPEPEQYYSEPVAPVEPEIDIPVLTAESVIPEPEPVKEIVDEPVAPEPTEEDTPDISPHLAYNDVKEAARDAKKTHGDAFAKQVLTDHDCDIKTTLGRSLTGIPEEKYQSVVQAWVKGPVKSTSMFEEEIVVVEEKHVVVVEEPTAEEKTLATLREHQALDVAPETEEEPVDQPDIEPEAVKMALRAYAKKHTKEAAKALMAEFDIPSLPAVSNADQATLTALFTKVL